MPIVPPTNSLDAIQTKVRRLTRSPSTAQLSDDDLNNYINTFVVYDFPEHLRTFNLRTTFSFFTNPYQDVYPTDIVSFGAAVNNPLYNFQNKYLTTVGDPVYIAGFQSFYTQSRQQLFNIYPMVNSIAQPSPQLFGDGIQTTFTGQIPVFQGNIITPGTNVRTGLLQYQVLINSVDATGQGISVVDIPVLDNVTGYNFIVGNLYDPSALPTTPPIATLINNNIDYTTGIFTVTFATPPAAGAIINTQTVPNNLSLPQALLYYNNKFTVRPVPDQVYKIIIECYIRPAALLALGQSPELEEYWQFIAYGAAKKILQDRLDMESVALIEPEYREQMRLCLRRTIVQYTNERVATIYTENRIGNNISGFGSGGWW